MPFLRRSKRIRPPNNSFDLDEVATEQPQTHQQGEEPTPATDESFSSLLRHVDSLSSSCSSCHSSSALGSPVGPAAAAGGMGLSSTGVLLRRQHSIRNSPLILQQHSNKSLLRPPPQQLPPTRLLISSPTLSTSSTSGGGATRGTNKAASVSPSLFTAGNSASTSPHTHHSRSFPRTWENNKSVVIDRQPRFTGTTRVFSYDENNSYEQDEGNQREYERTRMLPSATLSSSPSPSAHSPTAAAATALGLASCSQQCRQRRHAYLSAPRHHHQHQLTHTGTSTTSSCSPHSSIKRNSADLAARSNYLLVPQRSNESAESASSAPAAHPCQQTHQQQQSGRFSPNSLMLLSAPATVPKDDVRFVLEEAAEEEEIGLGKQETAAGQKCRSGANAAEAASGQHADTIIDKLAPVNPANEALKRSVSNIPSSRSKLEKINWMKHRLLPRHSKAELSRIFIPKKTQSLSNIFCNMMGTIREKGEIILKLKNAAKQNDFEEDAVYHLLKCGASGSDHDAAHCSCVCHRERGEDGDMKNVHATSSTRNIY